MPIKVSEILYPVRVTASYITWSYKENVTNEGVCAKIQRAVRPHKDHHKEMQTALVWSCLLFIKSGENHLTRHSERGKKTRQTEEEVGR